VGSVSSVKVGSDLILGGFSGELSDQLLDFFRTKGYYTLDHFCTHSRSMHRYWLDSKFFRLSGSWKNQWDSYVSSLYRLGVTLNPSKDKLLWAYNQSKGVVTSNLAYRFIISKDGLPAA